MTVPQENTQSQEVQSTAHRPNKRFVYEANNEQLINNIPRPKQSDQPPSTWIFNSSNPLILLLKILSTLSATSTALTYIPRRSFSFGLKDEDAGAGDSWICIDPTIEVESFGQKYGDE
jgi:hypothetical protein